MASLAHAKKVVTFTMDKEGRSAERRNRSHGEFGDPICSDNSKQIMEMLKIAYEGRTKQCTGLILELQKGAESIERVRRSWKNSDAQNQELAERLQKLQAEEDAKAQKIRQLEAQLTDARTQLRTQVTELSSLRVDFDENCARMDLLKEVLRDQISSLSKEHQSQVAFLREPGLTRSNSRTYGAEGRRVGFASRASECSATSEDDLDRTEDELEESGCTRSGRRFSNDHRRSAHGKRSRPLFAPITEEVVEVEKEVRMPRAKKSRDNGPTTTEVKTTVTMDASGANPSVHVRVRRSLNRRRSMSADNLAPIKTITTKTPLTPQCGSKSTVNLRTPRAAESWTQGQPLSTRAHTYVELSIMEKMMKNCDVCNRGLSGFKAGVRCQDCGQFAHDVCKQRLVLPCVPKSATRTPSRSRLNQRPRLKELCPDSAPMIPAALIHCVVALERGGKLDYEGIYRVNGKDEQIKNLLLQLTTERATPRMELQYVETITGCIKKLLESLGDPLIPKTSREEFVQAAQAQDSAMMHRGICELPQPNRDTLAYLMIHWKHVADRATKNKMPARNLAKALAKAVVGNPFSHIETGISSDDMAKQENVMLALLSIETEYWERFFAYEGGWKAGTTLMASASNFPPPTIRIPQSSSPRKSNAKSIYPTVLGPSLLGPVSETPVKGAGSSRDPPLIQPTPRRLFDPLT